MRLTIRALYRPSGTSDGGIYEITIQIFSIAVVCGKRPVIHFLEITQYNEAQLVRMSVVLVHEMAHCFGMNDVYDDPSYYDENGNFVSVTMFGLPCYCVGDGAQYFNHN